MEAPKIYTMRNGKSVCEMPLINYRYVGLGESRKKSECCVIAVAFGKLADFVRNLQAGDRVVGTGSLDYQTWEKDGQSNSTHKFMLSELVICKGANKLEAHEQWDWNPKI